MITEAGRIPIGRRAWLGDGRRGASVAPDGTVDWFCPEGVAGRPDLWFLLDPGGAAVRVGPVRANPQDRRRLPAAEARYIDGTNVLRTRSEAAGGRRLEVLDFLPWPGPGLEVPGVVVRLVRALSGPVDVEVEVLTGPSRGRARPVVAAGDLVALGGIEVRAGATFEPAPLGRDTERWRAVIRLDAGEETVVTVAPRLSTPALTTTSAHRWLDDTVAAWRSWSSAIVAEGPYRDTVVRSLLAVRSLTGPDGAPAGSGTASLPRRPASDRQRDERWVPVATVAASVRVLAAAGLAEDAEAAEAWLRGALAGADRPWPSWLGPDGQPAPEAEEWPLDGWRRSGPVWWGRPPGQPDLGLLGDVAGAVNASQAGSWSGRPGGQGPLVAAWPALAAQTDWVADNWERPDTGGWETASAPRLWVASRLRSWFGLDRMTRLARAANPLDLQAVAWQQESRRLLDWLEAWGVAADGGLRLDGGPTRTSDSSDEADAALLQVAWRGPWPAAHPLVGVTVDRVLERLGSGPLLYRYSDRVADGFEGPDQPDLVASLMAVKALARTGRWDEAHERMSAVVRLIGGADTSGPNSGVPASTADPVTGEMYGNFPSTATAVALVDAALELDAGPR